MDLFHSFRFTRILISISHIAAHADYYIGVNKKIGKPIGRQLQRRNFDGLLLHSPLQTYCMRLATNSATNNATNGGYEPCYENSNILYCCAVYLLRAIVQNACD